MKQKIAPFIILTLSIILIAEGILRGEAEAVIEKATRICMECIGIG